MNEELYNITELPITANEGWKEMQALLNEHLPAKSQPAYRKLLIRFSYITIISMVLLMSTLRLDNNAFQIWTGSIATGSISRSKIPAHSMALYENSNPLNLKKPADVKTVKNNGSVPSLNDDRLSSIVPGYDYGSSTPIDMLNEKMSGALTSDVIERKAGGAIHPVVNTLPAALILSAMPNDSRKAKGKGSWNLFGGIGMNASLNSSQNLQPYPVAEARYNLNSTIYIAAGISACSPVTTSTAGVSKITYLNDSLNNRNSYKEVTGYNHVGYADIPLFLGVNIGKNISIQTGIQTSILLNKKTTTVLSGPVFVPSAVTAANLQQEYDVRAHHFDYRFVAGVRYALNKTTIGVTYQHGLRSIGSGTFTANDRNHLLALSLVFKLK